MSQGRPLRIGARGSMLSLAQTELVRRDLAAANPGQAFEIVPIVTTGDKIQDRRLIEAGGKGLFTKELDEALLDGRVDLAVHSMKDVPASLPEGVALACTPRREDPRDALICNVATALVDLPDRARIGTASARRQAQILADRPTFDIVMLRGNVDSRLRKVAEGEVDATLLAYAGLRRLGLEAKVSALIDPDVAPPAAGQGALALTTRAGDDAIFAKLALIEHYPTRLEITAERAFLAALDGSCRSPIAALGRWSAGVLWFIGETLAPDGAKRWRRIHEATCATEAEAASVGVRLGDSIRAEIDAELSNDCEC